METNSKTLSVIDAHELMERYLPPPKFCVDTLLPHGLSILGGAPKVGKSWLVLDLCVHVAKGEPIWNLPTQQSAVLYLCLEDSEKRVQLTPHFVAAASPDILPFRAFPSVTG